MKTNLIIFGTRPELIKLLPILLEIRNRGWEKHFKLIYTRQHKDLINDLLTAFEITPDHTLTISNNNQEIALTLSDILKELQIYISNTEDEIGHILAQGDTTSCLAGAMIASMNQIPFAHVEAGLRTYDHGHPFPEEYFRQVISLSATIHFTPTQRATDNLLHEYVSIDKIRQVGNTIVDVIDIWSNSKEIETNDLLKPFLNTQNVLITCHRRENQNSNFDILIESVIELATTHPNLNFLWISHPSPFVQAKLDHQVLRNTPNIFVIEPVSLFDMFTLYEATKVIITDSGGIQEEAISFNVPTIVIREKTERCEAIESGNAQIVSLSDANIEPVFHEFLNSNLSIDKNPFGDGKAAIRILDYFGEVLSLSYQEQNSIQVENL